MTSEKAESLSGGSVSLHALSMMEFIFLETAVVYSIGSEIMVLV